MVSMDLGTPPDSGEEIFGSLLKKRLNRETYSK
jgi:hypothetical protein